MPTTQDIKQWIEDAIKWHRHDGVLTQLVYLTQLFGFRRRWVFILDGDYLSFSFIVYTDGTNVVSFPTDVFRVSNIETVSLDTTAANITIKNNGNTIATIAKGTVAGGVMGATSLSNTDFINGTLTVESSSAGNARVVISVLFPNN